MRFVSLIVCMMLAGTSYAEDKWYGLLTTDSFPIKNCWVTEISQLDLSKWIDGKSPANLNEPIQKLRDASMNSAKQGGFNAVLGYSVTFVGAGHEERYMDSTATIIGGLISARGVMVKVKCKANGR